MINGNFCNVWIEVVFNLNVLTDYISISLLGHVWNISTFYLIIFNSLLVITPKVFNCSACKLLENLIWTMEGRQFDSLMHSLYLTDGGYSEWTIFSPCTARCDGDQGNRVRRRFCINPEPSFGGNNCDGELNWICLILIPNFHLYFLLRFGSR